VSPFSRVQQATQFLSIHLLRIRMQCLDQFRHIAIRKGIRRYEQNQGTRRNVSRADRSPRYSRGDEDAV
jgi:hypothetical protein